MNYRSFFFLVSEEGTLSNFQHLPSISENKSESQDVFFRHLGLYSDESKNVQETARLKPLKILFYSMFCLLQTSDERIFWYSGICTEYCRNLKKKRNWAAKMATCT